MRRKGRMLVAKLDYLQYIAVRSVINNTTAQVCQQMLLLRSLHFYDPHSCQRSMPQQHALL